MQRVLAIFLSILCTALPLRSVAGANVIDAHCPHMQSMNTAPKADSLPHHDCCNDAATAAKTGQLCKTGQDCSPSFSYMLLQTPSLIAITTEPEQVPAVSFHIRTGPPDAVWRPPTLS